MKNKSAIVAGCVGCMLILCWCMVMGIKFPTLPETILLIVGLSFLVRSMIS